MPARLFVYGTLTDPACVERVTGRRFPARPAVLHDWTAILGEHGYRTIHRRTGSVVHGFVLDRLDVAALRALDAYEDEGRLYLRRSVSVHVDGHATSCDAYVCTACGGDGNACRSARGPLVQ